MCCNRATQYEKLVDGERGDEQPRESPALNYLCSIAGRHKKKVGQVRRTPKTSYKTTLFISISYFILRYMNVHSLPNKFT